MKNLVIFASGSGSNAQRICEYFKGREDVSIKLILSNKADAYVLERAKNLGVPSVTFNRDEFYKTDNILDLLKEAQTDYVILAGFLWLVPQNIIKAYSGRIINIHPALLPNYGGKGMYGDNVHKAVIANKEKESGITIHYVNEHYDEGQTIFQAKCDIEPTDTPEILAQKIHTLEYEHFPVIIEKVLFEK